MSSLCDFSELDQKKVEVEVLSFFPSTSINFKPFSLYLAQPEPVFDQQKFESELER